MDESTPLHAWQAERTLALFATADWLEEQGQEDLAAAYRSVALLRQAPLVLADGQRAWTSPRKKGDDRASSLPPDLWGALMPPTRPARWGSGWIYCYASDAAAYAALARAIVACRV